MKAGDIITLLAYGGEKITRRVVSMKRETIYVCTEKEYLQAHNERREPTAVGFNSRYVLHTEVKK